MLNMIMIELSKTFRKGRTFIGFIAIAILVPIVQIALMFEGEKYLNVFLQNIEEHFMLVGNLMNGYLIANVILQALFVHIPFLVVLVGGDLLAGEATAGTYRMLITRPVSRFTIVTSKFITGVIYTNILLFFLMTISLFLSIIIFGTGELIVVGNSIYIFAADDVMWRFFMAYGFATLSLTTVMALSFLFSSLVENAIGPIVASMAVIIILLIISALPIEILKSLKPFLFTTYMASWREFFRDPIDIQAIINSGLVLFGHILGFYLITLYLFLKKDITT